MTIDNDDDDDDDDDKLVVREALFSVVSEQCREMSVEVQSEHCAREQYLIPMHCKLYIHFFLKIRGPGRPLMVDCWEVKACNGKTSHVLLRVCDSQLKGDLIQDLMKI